jgi:DNA-binding PadR family transcriptional regulator
MIETFPDLDRLRLPDDQIPKHTTARPHRRQLRSNAVGVQGEFLKGPIPLSWLGNAAALPGKALATALAIMFEVGRRRSSEITLTTAIVQRFGVSRKAKYRALKHLESAGLITVYRKPHRNPVVTILDIKDQTVADSRRQDGTGTTGIVTENKQTVLYDRKEMEKQCAGTPSAHL